MEERQERWRGGTLVGGEPGDVSTMNHSQEGRGKVPGGERAEKHRTQEGFTYLSVSMWEQYNRVNRCQTEMQVISG